MSLWVGGLSVSVVLGISVGGGGEFCGGERGEGRGEGGGGSKGGRNSLNSCSDDPHWTSLIQKVS